MFRNFDDRRKIKSGLNAILCALYREVYGDRIQCLQLRHYYNRVIIKQHQAHIIQCRSKTALYRPSVMSGLIYDKFLGECDDVFSYCIKQCYTDYVVTRSLILSRDKVNELVSIYKILMTNQYMNHYEMLEFK